MVSAFSRGCVITAKGQVIILNGVPRSGKSQIVEAIQATFDGPWMNLGVDVYAREITPPRFRPGIGLRPGGERPDLEPWVETFYVALYESIAVHSRLGLNVVADFGHHDSYSRPLNILARCASRLEGLPVMLVGVRCPIHEIMERRNRGQAGREGEYAAGSAGEPIPSPVTAWQREVHLPGIYDLEVDTSALTPEECADAIRRRLHNAAPPCNALRRIAAPTG